MPVLLIETIQSALKGGSGTATIIGIDPTDKDCIHGHISGVKCKWSMSGLRRDGADPADSLDIKNDQIADVIGLCKQLGAR
jgi:hypothetical protein